MKKITCFFFSILVSFLSFTIFNLIAYFFFTLVSVVPLGGSLFSEFTPEFAAAMGCYHVTCAANHKLFRDRDIKRPIFLVGLFCILFQLYMTYVYFTSDVDDVSLISIIISIGLGIAFINKSHSISPEPKNTLDSKIECKKIPEVRPPETVDTDPDREQKQVVYSSLSSRNSFRPDPRSRETQEPSTFEDMKYMALVAIALFLTCMAMYIPAALSSRHGDSANPSIQKISSISPTTAAATTAPTETMEDSFAETFSISEYETSSEIDWSDFSPEFKEYLEQKGVTPIKKQNVASTVPETETKGVTSRGTPIVEADDTLDFDINYITRSSAISEIGYDYYEEVLLITFKDSGASYYYYDVPYEVYDELLNAESIGRYFNNQIRGWYDCVRVD